MSNSREALAKRVAEEYGKLDQVVAVALAGSVTSNGGDETSDLDIYVYSQDELPLDVRKQVAKSFSEQAKVGNEFWESGDDWVDPESGVEIDIMFRTQTWIQDQLDRVLVDHQASVGYSTCFWHNVLTSVILYDQGCFAELQAAAKVEYPEELKQAIINKNHPILRSTLCSYYTQLEKAIDRDDPVSINHRVAAILASVFDIVIAVNELPHPGEKRLLRFVTEKCELVPDDFDSDVRAVLEGDSRSGGLLSEVTKLMDTLDDFLKKQELFPNY